MESALLNPQRLSPRFKREAIEAVGVSWPVEWRRGIRLRAGTNARGFYDAKLSARRMQHVVWIRSDLCGPQLALTALHELVHALQVERAGGWHLRPAMRPLSRAEPWSQSREEAEAYRVSGGIMARLGDERTLREWNEEPINKWEEARLEERARMLALIEATEHWREPQWEEPSTEFWTAREE